MFLHKRKLAVLFVLTSLMCALSHFIEPSTAGIVTIDDDGDSTSSDGISNEYPLRSMKIEARIVETIAEVSMVQEFETAEVQPPSFTSVFYQLPLDEQAAITRFRAEVDERVLHAEVKEKKKAREEYEQAVMAGMRSYIGEEIRSDIFRIGLGNLPPSKIVRVTLVYVTELEAIGSDVIRFVLPTAIAPRYEPFTNSEGVIPIGEQLINNGVYITLSAWMATGVESIKSATHKIEIMGDMGLGMSNVHVLDDDPLRRDVFIDFKMPVSNQPRVYYEHSPAYSSDALMLTIVPEISQDMFEGFERKYEFIFVVDRSGSMSDKIETTRHALRYIIESLPVDSLFNIVGFGSSFGFLFEGGSRHVSDQSVYNQSLSYADTMKADMGGTEILGPLMSALQSESTEGYERLVFVLTDGQVSNTDDVIEFVQKHRSDSRVFSLGIGSHVSRLLVNGIARSGRGSSDFVNGDDATRMSDAIERQMNAAMTPALSDVHIFWDSAHSPVVRQAPFDAPPLLQGKRFTLFLLKDNASQPLAIKMSARVLQTGHPIEHTVMFKDFALMNAADTTDVVHKLAARELIRDLEEGRSWLHGKNTTEESIDNEILQLGVSFQIASSQTSFIAIDNEGWNTTTVAKHQKPSALRSSSNDPPKIPNTSLSAPATATASDDESRRVEELDNSHTGRLDPDGDVNVANIAIMPELYPLKRHRTVRSVPSIALVVAFIASVAAVALFTKRTVRGADVANDQCHIPSPTQILRNNSDLKAVGREDDIIFFK